MLFEAVSQQTGRAIERMLQQMPLIRQQDQHLRRRMDEQMAQQKRLCELASRMGPDARDAHRAAQTSQATLCKMALQSEELQRRQHALEDWLFQAQLAPEEHEYVRMRYFERYPLLRLEQTLGFSDRQCCRIRARALCKLHRVPGWETLLSPSLPPSRGKNIKTV